MACDLGDAAVEAPRSSPRRPAQCRPCPGPLERVTTPKTAIQASAPLRHSLTLAGGGQGISGTLRPAPRIDSGQRMVGANSGSDRSTLDRPARPHADPIDRLDA